MYSGTWPAGVAGPLTRLPGTTLTRIISKMANAAMMATVRCVGQCSVLVNVCAIARQGGQARGGLFDVIAIGALRTST